MEEKIERWNVVLEEEPKTVDCPEGAAVIRYGGPQGEEDDAEAVRRFSSIRNKVYSLKFTLLRIWKWL